MRSELMTNDLGVAVVNSRRVQDGVEIIEREVHLVTTFDVPAAQPAAPKLVVTDALTSAAESIIAKTRAEVEGLNALLQSFALGTPALK